MSFAIMRIAKIKAGSIGGTDKHNERKNKNYSNEDINLELSHLNYNLIECKSYKSAIDKQLEERYTASRSIRKDAVLGVEVIFTSDNEFFKKLTPEQERLYFEKSLEFLKDFAGEKNVISAVVHKDEKTPHLHCVFTPITDDGRLHFKSFINGKFELSKLQDKYYDYISKDFNLERGKSAEQTKRKHLSVAEYKLETAINERELELEKVNKNTEIIKSKNLDLETQKTQLENEQNNINQSLKDLEEFNKKLDNEKKEKERLKEKLSLEQKKFLKIEDIKNNVEERKPSFLNKEHKVILKKEDYDSLLQYALEGEKFYKEKIKKEKELTNLNKSYTDLKESYSVLSVNYNNLKISESSLGSENITLGYDLKIANMNLERKDKKLKENEIYIDKLEKALPSEKVTEIKNEIARESWNLKITKSLGRGD